MAGKKSAHHLTSQDVTDFGVLESRIRGFYEELQTLTRKSPNDTVNKFKLGLVNPVVAKANSFLPTWALPFPGFEGFDVDTLPSNSDVVVVLAQYLKSFEEFRCTVIVQQYQDWYWLIDGEKSTVKTKPPKRLGKDA